MAGDLGREIIALLPRLRRFARGLARSPDEADDLVQAACEKALRSAASFEPGTRLDSWMYRILRNVWIDQTRRGSMDSLDAEPVEVAGDDGRRIVQFRLELDDVRSGIAALPADQREVLLLVCVEDLSYRDASDVLNIPIGTVMSRLARARTALAAAMDGEDKPAREQARGASS